MTDVEAAKLLRMSTRNLADLRGKGVLPGAGSTADEYLDAYIPHLRAIRSGHVPRAEKVDLDNEKARLAREQADQVAMRNALMRRDLVPRQQIGDAVVSMIEVAKAKLARVPAKVSMGDHKLKLRVSDAIMDALLDVSAERALEEPEPDDDDEPGEDDEPGDH